MTVDLKGVWMAMTFWLGRVWGTFLRAMTWVGGVIRVRKRETVDAVARVLLFTDDKGV